jgi:hypothetical protein
MARKKKTQEDAEAASHSSNDSASSPENTKEEGAETVTIIKSGTAPKLSPRGDGQLTYQIGRMGDTVLVRISHNESSGRFSKEWVTVAAIRAALAQLPKGTNNFKGAVALKSAWTGQSSCNSGFGAAALKAEKVFDWVPDKKGMMRLSAADALDAWEKAMIALPLPANAERVLLHPPKPVPNFAKRAAKPVEGDAPADTDVEPVEDSDAEDAATEEDDE